MDFTYTVIFKAAEEGGYLAHVPTLNGATTEGDTLEEVREMARDLIEGIIETHIKLGRPIPVEESAPALNAESMTVSVKVVATAA